MSTLLVAAILVGSVAAICLLLIINHNKHKRETMNKILRHFSQIGTENNLSFSSQEMLNDSLLGLDGMKRKILVVKKVNDNYESMVIDLRDVKSCSVKKKYGTIKADDLKNNKLEKYLEEIVLHFDLNNKPSAEISFYNDVENNVYQTMELEQKARHWEAILSKMQMPVKKIA